MKILKKILKININLFKINFLYVYVYIYIMQLVNYINDLISINNDLSGVLSENDNKMLESYLPTNHIKKIKSQFGMSVFSFEQVSTKKYNEHFITLFVKCIILLILSKNKSFDYNIILSQLDSKLQIDIINNVNTVIKKIDPSAPTVAPTVAPVAPTVAPVAPTGAPSGGPPGPSSGGPPGPSSGGPTGPSSGGPTVVVPSVRSGLSSTSSSIPSVRSGLSSIVGGPTGPSSGASTVGVPSVRSGLSSIVGGPTGPSSGASTVGVPSVRSGLSSTSSSIPSVRYGLSSIVDVPSVRSGLSSTVDVSSASSIPSLKRSGVPSSINNIKFDSVLSRSSVPSLIRSQKRTFNIGDIVKTTDLPEYNKNVPVGTVGRISNIKKRYENKPNEHNLYKVDFEMYPYKNINDLENLYNASSLKLAFDDDDNKRVSYGNKYLKYKQKYLSLKSKI